ncbi:MAG: four helix bundle protein [Verrucomicrobia bacterium]|nr:four helix bundle protein [Verrucomicrobiota bacterium]
MTETLAECSAEELEFWGFAPTEEPLVLRDEGPPLVYDLEVRTTRFGEQIILFAKKIPWGPVNNRLIDQLVGAGTSVGANYCEADDGVSKADFKHRISICRKESRETKFFLRMVVTSEPNLKPDARELWKEAHALHRIFSRIWRSTKT